MRLMFTLVKHRVLAPLDGARCAGPRGPVPVGVLLPNLPRDVHRERGGTDNRAFLLPISSPQSLLTMVCPRCQRSF